MKRIKELDFDKNVAALLVLNANDHTGSHQQQIFHPLGNMPYGWPIIWAVISAMSTKFQFQNFYFKPGGWEPVNRG